MEGFKRVTDDIDIYCAAMGSPEDVLRGAYIGQNMIQWLEVTSFEIDTYVVTFGEWDGVPR